MRWFLGIVASVFSTSAFAAGDANPPTELPGCELDLSASLSVISVMLSAIGIRFVFRHQALDDLRPAPH
jgi:hypothetical protein